MALPGTRRRPSWPRLLAFGLLVMAVLMWQRASPPHLSDHNIKQASGRYACQRWPLSVRAGRVDGVRYASDFSHVFGYSNPGICFEELNGRMVVVRYVETPDPNPPLMLSLREADTGTVWGAAEADRLQQLRTYLGQPWWLLAWQGVSLLLLALLFFPQPFKRGVAAVGRIIRLSD